MLRSFLVWLCHNTPKIRYARSAGSSGVMRKVDMKNLNIILVFLFLADTVLAGPKNAKDVIDDFDKYVSMNKAFLTSVDAGKRKELRENLENYSELYLNSSLATAKHIVCNESNIEIIKGLFSLILYTSNSADEYSSKILGEMYICRPDVVSSVFRSLPKSSRIDVSGLFLFGFENAAYNMSDVEKMEKLRASLKSLLGRT